MILCIRPHEVDEHWGLLRQHFEDFADSSHGELTAEELRQMVREGRRQCWVYVNGSIKAVALTEKLKGGLWLDFCRGEGREEWQEDMVNAIRKFAEKEGDRMKVFCRPGWVPFLRKMGFRETHRFLEIEFDG